MHRLYGPCGSEEIAKLAVAATEIACIAEFEAWCRTEIRRLLPFGTLLCAAGRILSGVVAIESLHPVDHPVGYLAQIQKQFPLKDRRVIETWLATRRPQIVPANRVDADLSNIERTELRSFDLRNIVAHGVIAPDGLQATYFSFSRLPEPFPSDIEFRLKLIVPSMHQAFYNVQAAELGRRTDQQKGLGLTPRDLRVLQALMLGLTNAEIGIVVHRSPNTVKHQIATVMRKFGASNRAETVAKAMSIGFAPASAPVAAEKGPVRAIDRRREEEVRYAPPTDHRKAILGRPK